MVSLIDPHEFILPLQPEYSENYTFWERFHFGESFFKTYPLCDKMPYTYITYKIIGASVNNRQVAYGATLVRIALLQTGFFSDPNHECKVNPKYVKTASEKVKKDYLSESSDNAAFVRITKLFHDNVDDLLRTHMSAIFSADLADYYIHYNLVADMSKKYDISIELIQRMLTKGVAMLSVYGKQVVNSYYTGKYLTYFEVSDDSITMSKVCIIRKDDLPTISQIKTVSTAPSTAPTGKKLHRILRRALRKYDNELDRVYKRRKNAKKWDSDYLKRPSLPVIFQFFDYFHFKYKDEVKIR
jgi:hypothetical protein